MCLIIAVMLCACASVPQAPSDLPAAEEEPVSGMSLRTQHDSGRWITRPDDSALIIIGISGTRSKPEAEIENALDDAARKAAMFYGIRGSIDSVHAVGPGFLDWYFESEVNLEYDAGYEQYKESLTFDPQSDVLRAGGAVFVRFRHSAGIPQGIQYSSSRNADGSPEWIRRPPRIEGFLTGVGYAGKHQRLQDAVMRSFETAAAALLVQQSQEVESEAASSSEAGSYNGSLQHSAGGLAQFLVLEWYIDPKTQGVYTLAIAKSGE
jgi:hypothetical protein